MAITAAQRSLALQAITQAAQFGDTSVATLLPGVTAAQVWSTLLTALGTSVDAQFTTICSHLASQYQAAVNTSQAATSALQAQVTSVTVT